MLATETQQLKEQNGNSSLIEQGTFSSTVKFMHSQSQKPDHNDKTDNNERNDNDKAGP